MKSLPNYWPAEPIKNNGGTSKYQNQPNHMACVDPLSIAKHNWDSTSTNKWIKWKFDVKLLQFPQFPCPLARRPVLNHPSCPLPYVIFANFAETLQDFINVEWFDIWKQVLTETRIRSQYAGRGTRDKNVWKTRGMPGHCGRITPIWQSTRSCWRAPRALRIWDLRDKLHLARRLDRSDFIEFPPYPSYQPPRNSVFSRP